MIVSRGELVEIGGSFRIQKLWIGPVVVYVVGATNRTHVHDYENAIGDFGFTDESAYKQL